MTLAQAATVAALTSAKGVQVSAKVVVGFAAIVFVAGLEGYQRARELGRRLRGKSNDHA